MANALIQRNHTSWLATAEVRERCLSDSIYRLKRLFENAQSVASGRQLEKPLIFPREIQQNVSRVDTKHQEKKEEAFSNNAGGQEHRHQTESANARSEQGK